MTLGDTYAKDGELVKAEKVYKIAYDNDKIKRLKYEAFGDAQQKFLGKVKEEEKSQESPQ